MICDRLGIDVWELIRLANHHPRVNIMQPSAGVGGHCIAVDPWFIVHSAPEEARIIRAAREVNNSKPQWVVRRVLQAIEEHEKRNGVHPISVALLGLAFKPDIDDLRESPAVEIALELRSLRPELRILAVEPHIDKLPPSLDSLQLCHLEEGLAESDIVAVLVGHSIFRAIGLDQITKKSVIDATGTLAKRSTDEFSTRPSSSLEALTADTELVSTDSV
jgi:UDP-N-acetyl-D-mannosaminuronic acid dehydrogenase